MKRVTTYLSWMFVLTFLLSSCGLNTASPTTPTIVPSLTATSLPTLIPTQTFTPTAIPTATEIPNPLEISAMRARDYPGSDVVIEKVLEPGANYSRYYVSYL